MEKIARSVPEKVILDYKRLCMKKTVTERHLEELDKPEFDLTLKSASCEIFKSNFQAIHSEKKKSMTQNLNHITHVHVTRNHKVADLHGNTAQDTDTGIRLHELA